MKTLIRISAVAAAFAIAVPASAQQKTERGSMVGVGVGLSNGSAFETGDRSNLGFGGTLLFVPLNIAPNLRVEPFIGWARSDIDAIPPGGAGLSNPGEASDFTLGAGVFFVQPVAAQLQVYVGGRLGLQWQSFKTVGAAPDKFSRRNTLLAAVGGAEYLPIPRVAVGAELMIGYVGFGDTEFKDGATGQTFEGAGGSGSVTQGTLFARLYLF
jgi:opacity protein-like surface antigen